ncbi:hypothetical protein L873DRAFT_1805024 [Choiromyces venosus 120613-1]|uniref:Uncharacterized protein n=1 Tax=Choiromyces venosus 120613-1 TaxID=1336337 RepID=A0A3N4JUQ8_9PEZI|nr:hypothetical protein L873DRAFT_1805024 [Choiromyces venosus 120613-1]
MDVDRYERQQLPVQSDVCITVYLLQTHIDKIACITAIGIVHLSLNDPHPTHLAIGQANCM